jgi:hypothetical protein
MPSAARNVLLSTEKSQARYDQSGMRDWHVKGNWRKRMSTQQRDSYGLKKVVADDWEESTRKLYASGGYYILSQLEPAGWSYPNGTPALRYAAVRPLTLEEALTIKLGRDQAVDFVFGAVEKSRVG